MNTEIGKIAIFCMEKINLEIQNTGYEFNYASLPLCVVDSVFSIGVKYESVTNVVKNLCNYFKIKAHYKDNAAFPQRSEQVSVSEFRSMFKNLTFEQIAVEIFKNKQRTSTRSGILKAEAVIKFLGVLISFKAEYFEDVNGLFENKDFESEIKKIPGQVSGISLKYFFMLAGNDNMVKADRMIIRFLSNILEREVKNEECLPLLVGVSKELNDIGYKCLTPKLLDNKIWLFQREVKPVVTKNK